MGYTTIRISEGARDSLRRLAAEARRPMQSVLEDAVEALRRQLFLERINAAYASLRADPKKWKRLEVEREAWDVTLGDGLGVSESRPRYGRARKRGRSR